MTFAWWECLIAAVIFQFTITGAITFRIYLAKRRMRVLGMLRSYNFGASVRTLADHECARQGHSRKTISRDLEWWARKGFVRRKTYGAGIIVYLINETGE